MRKRLGRWLAETRSGRMVFLAVTVCGVLGAAYMVIRGEVGRQTQEITERVTVIEEVSPYDVVLRCLRSPSCRHLFEHPDRALRKVRQDAAEGGDALQPSTGKQQPGPQGGGEQGLDGGQGQGQGGGQEREPNPSDPAGGADSPGQSEGHPERQTDAPSTPNAPSVPDQSRRPKSLPGQVTERVEEAAKGATETAEGAVETATCNALASLCSDR